MKSIIGNDELYIDVRDSARRETLSYDLSRHLPRRMAVGPALVVADNPSVFLSVIRKRLTKLLQEIDAQHARTLNRQRRAVLAEEARRLRGYRFTAKPANRGLQPDALFAEAAALLTRAFPCRTLYLTTGLTRQQLVAALSMLAKGGLLVVYGEWTTEHEAAVADHTRVVL